TPMSITIWTNDPGLIVTFDGNPVTIPPVIRPPDEQWPYEYAGTTTLSVGPGDHRVLATKSGRVLHDEPFTLSPGESRRVAVLTPPPSPIPQTSDGFVPLFNGKDLTGWKTHPDAPGKWAEDNGA